MPGRSKQYPARGLAPLHTAEDSAVKMIVAVRSVALANGGAIVN